MSENRQQLIPADFSRFVEEHWASAVRGAEHPEALTEEAKKPAVKNRSLGPEPS